jgi:hypothetical protein
MDKRNTTKGAESPRIAHNQVGAMQATATAERRWFEAPAAGT